MVNYTVVTPFVVYLLILLGIGIVANRFLGDLEGYLLGGRTIGGGVTALTLQSTSMSGFMFLGAPALHSSKVFGRSGMRSATSVADS